MNGTPTIFCLRCKLLRGVADWRERGDDMLIELDRGVPGVRSVKNDLTYQEGREAMGATRSRSRHDGAAMAARGYQQHVKMMQQALKENGYEPGPIDGIMGPQTASGLMSYQQKENLTVTSRADAETLGRLGVGVGGGGD